MRATAPPAPQAPRTAAGDPTVCATRYGLMKMPDPMIPPITTIVASNGPRARRKLTGAPSYARFASLGRATRYNDGVARGWESKSVESQQADREQDDRRPAGLSP